MCNAATGEAQRATPSYTQATAEMLRTRHTCGQMVRAEQKWLAGLSVIEELCDGANADWRRLSV